MINRNNFFSQSILVHTNYFMQKIILSLFGKLRESYSFACSLAVWHCHAHIDYIIRVLVEGNIDRHTLLFPGCSDLNNHTETILITTLFGQWLKRLSS